MSNLEQLKQQYRDLYGEYDVIESDYKQCQAKFIDIDDTQIQPEYKRLKEKSDKLDKDIKDFKDKASENTEKTKTTRKVLLAIEKANKLASVYKMRKDDYEYDLINYQAANPKKRADWDKLKRQYDAANDAQKRYINAKNEVAIAKGGASSGGDADDLEKEKIDLEKRKEELNKESSEYQKKAKKNSDDFTDEVNPIRKKLDDKIDELKRKKNEIEKEEQKVNKKKKEDEDREEKEYQEKMDKWRKDCDKIDEDNKKEKEEYEKEEKEYKEKQKKQEKEDEESYRDREARNAQGQYEGQSATANPQAANLRKLLSRGSSVQGSLFFVGKGGWSANKLTNETIKKELFTTAVRQTMSDERIIQGMANRRSMNSRNSAQLIRDV